VGLGCAAHSVDDRSVHLDEWNQRAAQREDFAGRGSGGDDVFLRVHLSAGCRGGRAHALAPRRFWCEEARAASLAHVLWAVHRGGVLFLGRREPAAEIAFDGRARATPAPGFIQHKPLFSSHHTSTGFAGFLAGARSFHEYIQETRCSFCPQVLINDVTVKVGTGLGRYRGGLL